MAEDFPRFLKEAWDSRFQIPSRVALSRDGSALLWGFDKGIKEQSSPSAKQAGMLQAFLASLALREHMTRLSHSRTAKTVGRRQSGVGSLRPSLGRLRTVAVEHLPAAPAEEVHEVAFVAAVGEPLMGEGVPEEVGMNLNANRRAAALQHLLDAVGAEASLHTEPELWAVMEGMLTTLAQIAREDLSSRVTVPKMPYAVALLRHRNELLLLIDVVEREVCNSTAARARVVKESHNREVPPILEAVTLARLEQCLYFLRWEYTTWLFLYGRPDDPRHRRFCYELFAEKPTEERVEAPVVCGHCGRGDDLHAGEQVVLDVDAGDLRHVLRQDNRHLFQGLRVNLNGPRRASTQAQVPLEVGDQLENRAFTHPDMLYCTIGEAQPHKQCGGLFESVVEPAGLEPATSTLPVWRSPN